ncbi:unnamed protein product [Heligmosomoides polygyrus]|uniref:HTH_48 domain-containing protein n=1 Tax=Heligmosomoides polygyrus TaxID=6339 RepID=A0A183GF21_HELPZ|nr:unnamed protein product [Heligmosomoides polygyrus]
MSEAPKDPSEQQADAMDVEIANGETSQPVESQSIVNTFISSLEIVEKLVLELHDALENLHEEAHKKQVAANKAKNEIATVENQLRALLTMTDFTGVLKLNRVSSQPQPKGNATPRSHLVQMECGVREGKHMIRANFWSRVAGTDKESLQSGVRVCLLYDFKQGRTAAESHRILSEVFGVTKFHDDVNGSDGFNVSETMMRALKAENINGVLKLWIPRN